MPSPYWTATAVAGKVLSGVEVATTIRSIACASMPAWSRAARAALIARCEVNSPSAAMWRCRIPVRCTIHSSEVSIRAASSALVRSRSRARPNVLQSRDSLLRGLRLSQRAAVAIEHLFDLVHQVVAGHLIANIDRIGKALGI